MSGGPFLRAGLTLAVHALDHGRPMLFQHGLCGDARQTAEVFPTGIGWQGLTLECRGHGASEAGPLDDLSLGVFAADLAVFIEERIGGPVVLGGISMGAALALSVAAQRPDLVSGLVLARPCWLCDPAPRNMAPYALVGDLMSRHAPDAAREAFECTETALRLARDAPDNLATLMGFFSREPTQVTAALLTRIAADDPGVTSEQVRALRAPTLVLGHGRDFAHPFAFAESLARLIPAARLAPITPKAESRAIYASDFRAALARFLEELPA